jgi:hypothetical protein
MARFGSLESNLNRFLIAELGDGNDIGILSQGMP